MYKVIWLTKFRADVPRDEVLAWWRGPHADLAKATPGMIRYVQSYWTSALDDDAMPTGELGMFDGHAEHWFPDREAYEQAMRSEQWRLCREDGPTGFDTSTLVGAEVAETVINWTP
jgi:hypothetical protein